MRHMVKNYDVPTANNGGRGLNSHTPESQELPQVLGHVAPSADMSLGTENTSTTTTTSTTSMVEEQHQAQQRDPESPSRFSDSKQLDALKLLLPTTSSESSKSVRQFNQGVTHSFELEQAREKKKLKSQARRNWKARKQYGPAVANALKGMRKTLAKSSAFVPLFRETLKKYADGLRIPASTVMAFVRVAGPSRFPDDPVLHKGYIRAAFEFCTRSEFTAISNASSDYLVPVAFGGDGKPPVSDLMDIEVVPPGGSATRNPRPFLILEVLSQYGCQITVDGYSDDEIYSADDDRLSSLVFNEFDPDMHLDNINLLTGVSSTPFFLYQNILINALPGYSQFYESRAGLTDPEHSSDRDRQTLTSRSPLPHFIHLDPDNHVSALSMFNPYAPPRTMVRSNATKSMYYSFHEEGEHTTPSDSSDGEEAVVSERSIFDTESEDSERDDEDVESSSADSDSDDSSGKDAEEVTYVSRGHAPSYLQALTSSGSSDSVSTSRFTIPDASSAPGGSETTESSPKAPPTSMPPPESDNVPDTPAEETHRPSTEPRSSGNTITRPSKKRTSSRHHSGVMTEDAQPSTYKEDGFVFSSHSGVFREKGYIDSLTPTQQVFLSEVAAGKSSAPKSKPSKSRSKNRNKPGKNWIDEYLTDTSNISTVFVSRDLPALPGFGSAVSVRSVGCPERDQPHEKVSSTTKFVGHTSHTDLYDSHLDIYDDAPVISNKPKGDPKRSVRKHPGLHSPSPVSNCCRSFLRSTIVAVLLALCTLWAMAFVTDVYFETQYSSLRPLLKVFEPSITFNPHEEGYCYLLRIPRHRRDEAATMLGRMPVPIVVLRFSMYHNLPIPPLYYEVDTMLGIVHVRDDHVATNELSDVCDALCMTTFRMGATQLLDTTPQDSRSNSTGPSLSLVPSRYVQDVSIVELKPSVNDTLPHVPRVESSPVHNGTSLFNDEIVIDEMDLMFMYGPHPLNGTHNITAFNLELAEQIAVREASLARIANSTFNATRTVNLTSEIVDEIQVSEESPVTISDSPPVEMVHQVPDRYNVSSSELNHLPTARHNNATLTQEHTPLETVVDDLPQQIDLSNTEPLSHIHGENDVSNFQNNTSSESSIVNRTSSGSQDIFGENSSTENSVQQSSETLSSNNLVTVQPPTEPTVNSTAVAPLTELTFVENETPSSPGYVCRFLGFTVHDGFCEFIPRWSPPSPVTTAERSRVTRTMRSFAETFGIQWENSTLQRLTAGSPVAQLSDIPLNTTSGVSQWERPMKTNAKMLNPIHPYCAGNGLWLFTKYRLPNVCSDFCLSDDIPSSYQLTARFRSIVSNVVFTVHRFTRSTYTVIKRNTKRAYSWTGLSNVTTVKMPSIDSLREYRFINSTLSVLTPSQYTQDVLASISNDIVTSTPYRALCSVADSLTSFFDFRTSKEVFLNPGAHLNECFTHGGEHALLSTGITTLQDVRYMVDRGELKISQRCSIVGVRGHFLLIPPNVKIPHYLEHFSRPVHQVMSMSVIDGIFLTTTNFNLDPKDINGYCYLFPMTDLSQHFKAVRTLGYKPGVVDLGYYYRHHKVSLNPLAGVRRNPDGYTAHIYLRTSSWGKDLLTQLDELPHHYRVGFSPTLFTLIESFNFHLIVPITKSCLELHFPMIVTYCLNSQTRIAEILVTFFTYMSCLVIECFACVVIAFVMYKLALYISQPSKPKLTWRRWIHRAVSSLVHPLLYPLACSQFFLPFFLVPIVRVAIRLIAWFTYFHYQVPYQMLTWDGLCYLKYVKPHNRRQAFRYLRFFPSVAALTELHTSNVNFFFKRTRCSLLKGTFGFLHTMYNPATKPIDMAEMFSQLMNSEYHSHIVGSASVVNFTTEDTFTYSAASFAFTVLACVLVVFCVVMALEVFVSCMWFLVVSTRIFEKYVSYSFFDVTYVTFHYWSVFNWVSVKLRLHWNYAFVVTFVVFTFAVYYLVYSIVSMFFFSSSVPRNPVTQYFSDRFSNVVSVSAKGVRVFAFTTTHYKSFESLSVTPERYARKSGMLFQVDRDDSVCGISDVMRRSQKDTGSGSIAAFGGAMLSAVLFVFQTVKDRAASAYNYHTRHSDQFLKGVSDANDRNLKAFASAHSSDRVDASCVVHDVSGKALTYPSTVMLSELSLVMDVTDSDHDYASAPIPYNQMIHAAAVMSKGTNTGEPTKDFYIACQLAASLKISTAFGVRHLTESSKDHYSSEPEPPYPSKSQHIEKLLENVTTFSNPVTVESMSGAVGENEAERLICSNVVTFESAGKSSKTVSTPFSNCTADVVVLPHSLTPDSSELRREEVSTLSAFQRHSVKFAHQVAQAADLVSFGVVSTAVGVSTDVEPTDRSVHREMAKNLNLIDAGCARTLHMTDLSGLHLATALAYAFRTGADEIHCDHPFHPVNSAPVSKSRNGLITSRNSIAADSTCYTEIVDEALSGTTGCFPSSSVFSYVLSGGSTFSGGVAYSASSRQSTGSRTHFTYSKTSTRDTTSLAGSTFDGAYNSFTTVIAVTTNNVTVSQEECDEAYVSTPVITDIMFNTADTGVSSRSSTALIAMDSKWNKLYPHHKMPSEMIKKLDDVLTKFIKDMSSSTLSTIVKESSNYKASNEIHSHSSVATTFVKLAVGTDSSVSRVSSVDNAMRVPNHLEIALTPASLKICKGLIDKSGSLAWSKSGLHVVTFQDTTVTSLPLMLPTKKDDRSQNTLDHLPVRTHTREVVVGHTHTGVHSVENFDKDTDLLSVITGQHSDSLTFPLVSAFPPYVSNDGENFSMCMRVMNVVILPVVSALTSQNSSVSTTRRNVLRPTYTAIDGIMVFDVDRNDTLSLDRYLRHRTLSKPMNVHVDSVRKVVILCEHECTPAVVRDVDDVIALRLTNVNNTTTNELYSALSEDRRPDLECVDDAVKAYTFGPLMNNIENTDCMVPLDSGWYSVFSERLKLYANTSLSGLSVSDLPDVTLLSTGPSSKDSRFRLVIGDTVYAQSKSITAPNSSSRTVTYTMSKHDGKWKSSFAALPNNVVNRQVVTYQELMNMLIRYSPTNNREGNCVLKHFASGSLDEFHSYFIPLLTFVEGVCVMHEGRFVLSDISPQNLEAILKSAVIVSSYGSDTTMSAAGLRNILGADTNVGSFNATAQKLAENQYGGRALLVLQELLPADELSLENLLRFLFVASEASVSGKYFNIPQRLTVHPLNVDEFALFDGIEYRHNYIALFSGLLHSIILAHGRTPTFNTCVSVVDSDTRVNTPHNIRYFNAIAAYAKHWFSKHPNQEYASGTNYRPNREYYRITPNTHDIFFECFNPLFHTVAKRVAKLLSRRERNLRLRYSQRDPLTIPPSLTSLLKTHNLLSQVGQSGATQPVPALPSPSVMDTKILLLLQGHAVMLSPGAPLFTSFLAMSSLPQHEQYASDPFKTDKAAFMKLVENILTEGLEYATKASESQKFTECQKLNYVIMVRALSGTVLKGFATYSSLNGFKGDLEMFGNERWVSDDGGFFIFPNGIENSLIPRQKHYITSFELETDLLEMHAELLRSTSLKLSCELVAKTTAVEGVAGSGKSTAIIRRVKNILTTTSSSLILVLSATRQNVINLESMLLETMQEIHDGEKLLSRVRVTTVDSHILHGLRDGKRFKQIQYVFIDEYKMVHPSLILAMFAPVRSIKNLYVYGDSQQIPFVSRLSTMANLRYVDLPYVSHEYSPITYRFGKDTVDVVKVFYPKGIVSGVDRDSGIEYKLITSAKDIPTDAHDCLMTYTQAEKQALSNIPGFEGVKTVHELQGSSVENAALVRLNIHDSPIYSSNAHVLVALTRHKYSLVYYTVKVSDMTVKVITKAYDPEIDTNAALVVNHVRVKNAEHSLLQTVTVNFTNAHYTEDTLNDEVLTTAYLIGALHSHTKFHLSREFHSLPVVMTPTSIDVDGTFDLFQYLMRELHVHFPPEIPGAMLMKSQAAEMSIPSEWIYRPDQFDRQRYTYTDQEPSDRLLSVFRADTRATEITRDLAHVFTALYKRNYDVQDISGYNPPTFTSDVISKVLEGYCDSIRLAEARTFIQPCDVYNLWSSMYEKPESQRSKYLRARFHMSGTYYGAIKATAKQSFEHTNIHELLASQTIAEADPHSLLKFTSVAFYLANVFNYSMKSKFMMLNGPSGDVIDGFITNHLNPLTTFKVLEFDASKFDKSQGVAARDFESAIMRELGIPEEIVTAWDIAHISARIIFRNFGLMIPTFFQRKSGDSLTFMGNTLLLMAMVAFVIDLDKVHFGMFAGDDCILFVHADYTIPDLSAPLALAFNMSVKAESNVSSMYFASRYIVRGTDGYRLVPDPLKILRSLVRNDLKCDEHVLHYSVSLADLTRCYDDINVCRELAMAVDARLSSLYDLRLPPGYTFLVVKAISTLSSLNSYELLLKFYEADPEVRTRPLLLEERKVVLKQLFGFTLVGDGENKKYVLEVLGQAQMTDEEYDDEHMFLTS